MSLSKTSSAGIKMILFGVVTLLATGLLAVTIGNVAFRSTVDYRAVFTDAVNLNSGDDVRLAGVRVGTVDGVDLVTPRGADAPVARVSFSVDSDVPVFTTTKAVIRYRNLIGQRYLALVDGPGDGTAMRPGQEIPQSRTEPALNLNALFNGFRPLLTALSPQQVNQLAYEVIRVLQGEGGTVDSLLARVASVTSTLADRDALIGQVIDNLNAVLGPIAARDQQVGALIGNLQQFVSGLSADRNAIGDALVSIDQLTGTTSSLLTDARPALKNDVTQLGVLASKLDEPASRALIQHFLTYTPTKLKVSMPAISYGSWLNFYLCAVSFITPAGSETAPTVNTTPRCQT